MSQEVNRATAIKSLKADASSVGAVDRAAALGVREADPEVLCRVN